VNVGIAEIDKELLEVVLVRVRISVETEEIDRGAIGRFGDRRESGKW
jgi:hypothetical protein